MLINFSLSSQDVMKGRTTMNIDLSRFSSSEPEGRSRKAVNLRTEAVNLGLEPELAELARKATVTSPPQGFVGFWNNATEKFKVVLYLGTAPSEVTGRKVRWFKFAYVDLYSMDLDALLTPEGLSNLDWGPEEEQICSLKSFPTRCLELEATVEFIKQLRTAAQ